MNKDQSLKLITNWYLQMLNNVDEKLVPPVKQINEKYLWKWQKWQWKYNKVLFRA